MGLHKMLQDRVRGRDRVHDTAVKVNGFVLHSLDSCWVGTGGKPNSAPLPAYPYGTKLLIVATVVPLRGRVPSFPPAPPALSSSAAIPSPVSTFSVLV